MHDVSPTHLPATRDGVEEAIRETLIAEDAVVAAYLFGSLARGHTGPLSDVDVGLLIAGNARGEVAGRVTDALCRRLRTSKVDVLSLTDAPAPLRYRVVREGVLVLGRDAAVLERFIAESVLQYLDFKPLRDRAFDAVRKAILEAR